MKGISLRAVELTRRIRDRHAKALAGKSPADVVAFYRAAGKAAMEDATSSPSLRRTPANKALQPTSRALRTQAKARGRAARG